MKVPQKLQCQKISFGSEPCKIEPKHTFLDCVFTKNVAFGLQTTFFNSFNVLFSFLAEKLHRTIMKSPQKVSFGTKTCSFGK